MKIRKDVILTVLAILCLTTVIFMVIPIMGGVGDYDPWIDTNDDGKMDMKDVATVARAFGTSGTPINKTDMLLQHEVRITALEAKVGSLEVIAAGYINSDGTFTKSYNIQSVTWSGTYRRYGITITGVGYYFSNYITIVTCVNDTANFATISSVANNLLVYVHDTAGNLVTCDFSFVTYKIS
jgi:hypothetical protein